ncbi:Acetolactate synthase large subunit [Bathymodiolus thermophilus thioautotrophic gill symbiont]|uniref:Acetolactate synthase large subunit n=1 Tax=Bathymodiolus thermophilus thioautotrophic gill symbiont TaxID=2360 RepID=A0A1J5TXG5_9GAMM|nr:acetolactate synthase large subunit [Bathymodiolus thermophilus thioautotrophic gill symbiont]AYQ56431.1 Thiamine pyrophosphate-requiring enzyme [Bathymodiolus thermophilus thioautotrophic gill symbiont]OIR24908.1 acetolactate synthase large subunit [Bathymodiolus thermophilus thioautotrophic gill symbiont]CAB5496281.1 Thiamine pyrophosphate-requiring enzymes [Bathymodiolus thermophilus thioautotrophic gill symbiont]CAB5506149.1 Thiamine pyrophosphate-requiring enzymes [Bathymodiolus thermop
MKASDLFVKALENEGVAYIFGIPGEENLDLLDSLRSSSIRFILTRHEQGAAFMAATYGRLTGKAGVCLATLGPGATNLVTCAAYAQLGAFPMLMITGQKPIHSSKQGRFQIIDVVRMMEPLTKSSRQIVNGGMIPPMVRDAFRLAEEERPGAVHLELPEDVAAEEVKEWRLFPVNEIRRPDADKQAIEIAVEMIKKAKNPLVLIGAGANRKKLFKPMQDFIDKTCIPFFNTQMGKGVVSCKSPLFLGTAALSEGDVLHRAVKMADLIINIGHDVVEKPPFFMREGGTQVIHVNFNSAQVDEVYFPQLEIIGDIQTTVNRLAEALDSVLTNCSLELLNFKNSIKEVIHEQDNNNAYPLLPQRIVADVRRALTEDAIIALDNGMYKLWFARHYHTYMPNTVLLDNALATMGAGLPSAMACALLYPQRQVMAICGDGGFMMNSQEMETAVRLKLNLVVLIITDSAYGMIRWKQEGQGFADFGLTYNNPDFVKYAHSYGAQGHKVQSTDEFKPLIESCFAQGGVHIIDVPIDYQENDKLLPKQLQKV